MGPEELAYRQAVRTIDRMLQWETGMVKRKQRASFARFLRHSDERIRKYAEGVAARAEAAPGHGDRFDLSLDELVGRVEFED